MPAAFAWYVRPAMRNVAPATGVRSSRAWPKCVTTVCLPTFFTFRYARNFGDKDAHLKMTITSGPATPEMLTVPIIAVGVIVAALAIYQFSMTEWDSYRYPPPGKLVDIGGLQLHINCTGAGSPTVILEAGPNDSSIIWQLVAEQETMKNTKFLVKLIRGTRAVEYVERIDRSPVQTTLKRNLALVMGKLTAEDVVNSLGNSRCIPELVPVQVTE